MTQCTKLLRGNLGKLDFELAKRWYERCSAQVSRLFESHAFDSHRRQHSSGIVMNVEVLPGAPNLGLHVAALDSDTDFANKVHSLATSHETRGANCMRSTVRSTGPVLSEHRD